MLKNDVKVEKTLFRFAHTRKTLYFCIVFFIVLDLRLTRLEQGVAPFFIPQPLLSLFFSSESERWGIFSDWTARKVELDLSKILGEGEYVAEVFRDGPNADMLGEDYIREVVAVPASRKVVADMAPAGGYVMKITKK